MQVKAIGFFTAALAILTFIGGIVFATINHAIQQPSVSYAGVGIKDPGPGEWIGTHEVIDAIHEVLRKEYPSVDNILTGNLWLVEVAQGQPVTSVSVPTGKISGEPITGTIDNVKSGIMGTGHDIYEVIVRRFPDGACSTDIVAHEVAEHIVPLIVTGNVNATHAPKWQPLTAEILAVCRSKLQTAKK